MRLLFVLLVLALSLEVVAQQPEERFIQKYELGLTFGVYEISNDSFPNKKSSDFMNYLYDYDDWVDYGYLGFCGHIWLRGGWELDTRVGVNSAFVPIVAKLGVSYFLPSQWGLSFELSRLSQYMNEYNAFHKQTDVEFIGDLNTNYRQIRVHDRGIKFGLVRRYQLPPFTIEGSLVIGYASTRPFNVVIYQKQVDGNLLRKYEYKTHETPFFVIYPKLVAVYTRQTKRNRDFGIELGIDYSITRRSIDYTRTVWLWTFDIPKSIDVSPDKHTFSKLEFNFALKWKW